VVTKVHNIILLVWLHWQDLETSS